MKLDRKTLIGVGAIALGIYLWYKYIRKKNEISALAYGISYFTRKVLWL
jgi:hypothetical protein